VLEELNQRETDFNKYESFCFENEAHVPTTTLYPVPMDYLVLFPGDSERYNPGCVKNYGNFVGGILAQIGPMECLVPASLKQSPVTTSSHI